MMIPTLLNFGVVVSYPCRGPTRLRPSSLALWNASALLVAQLASGASNVDGEAWETLHETSCVLAVALAFPMLTCIRTHLVVASLLNALALFSLLIVSLGDLVQLRYAAEFTGHTALLLATVLGTTRMVE